MIFFSQLDVLINCLPLTEKTKYWIDSKVFQRLPQGTFFINISRGGVVRDEDLINAMNEQQITAAVLDVFATEPLPSDSPYWNHPQVYITPHVSGRSYARTAAKIIAEKHSQIRGRGKGVSSL